MTGPRVDVPAAPRIPTLAEWEQQQYLTGPAAKRIITSPVAAKETVPALSRIPTLAEFNQMQGMSAPAISALRIPALPKLTNDYGDKVSIAPRDNTINPLMAKYAAKGKTASEFAKETHGIAGVVDNLAAPILDHPWMTAGAVGATMIPVVGPFVEAFMAGDLASGVALYGYQKHLEQQATPEARKIMEADKERISGEAAIAQGIMVGMIAAHAGSRALGKATDVSAGLMDASDLGAHGGQPYITRPGTAEVSASTEIHADPRGVDARKNASFASGIEARAADAANAHTGNPPPRPKGFTTDTESSRAGAGAKPVDGLIVPETVTAGRVKALDTQSPADLMAEVSASRAADAAKIAREEAMRPRRRAAALVNTEQGAEMLGTAAAQHGLPADASPFIPNTARDVAWKAGHESVTSGETPAGFQPSEPLPSYPEGFTMGGSLRESRIPAKSEIPKAAKGIDPAPVTEPVAAGTGSAQGLTPVEGTGDVRTRGLSASVARDAIRDKLVETLGDLPEYRQVNMADQAAKVSDFIARDPALARRVALGEAPAPDGILPESVFTAVERQAKAAGDAATVYELAHGDLTRQATTMGQRIRALGERDPESPVDAIRDANDVRTTNKNVPKATAKEVSQIRTMLKESKMSPGALKAFIESLKC